MLVPTIGASLADNYLFWWGAQLAALVIIIWLILRWKPGFLRGRTIGQTLNYTLDQRAQQIQNQLQAAEESRKEAERIQREAAQDVERARSEADQIIARAHSTAGAIENEMERRAHEEYQRVVGQAREEIEYERRQAEAALRRRAADIVVEAAGQIVRQNLEVSSDRRLIDQSLADLSELR